MSSDSDFLAQAVATFLCFFLPCLLCIGNEHEEEVGRELGAEAWDSAQALWKVLQPKVDEKPAAREAARDVANDPQDDDAQAALRLQLKKLLVEDPNLAENVDRLWQQAAMLQPPGSVSVSGNRNVVVGGPVNNSIINTGILTVLQHYRALKDDFCDFSNLINSIAARFVGRAEIFDELDKFQQNHACGYFCITANAGLGKTALAAAISTRYNACTFFTSRAEGLTHATRCLNHLAVDLIARFKLTHDHLPINAGQDSRFLSQILVEATTKATDAIWLVVDALDEADASSGKGNPLLLPSHLPDGVYVVVTGCTDQYTLQTTESTYRHDYVFRSDSKMQQDDIKEFLNRQLRRPEVIQALSSLNPPVDDEALIKRLQVSSEGNFKYLDYVILEIVSGDLQCVTQSINPLPKGLDAYYEGRWSQFEAGRSLIPQYEWDALHPTVIGLLAAAAAPVTLDWLSDHARQDTTSIRTRALKSWRHLISNNTINGVETWRIDHQSFRAFLAKKVDIVAMHSRIADYYKGVARNWNKHNSYAYQYLSAHLSLAKQHKNLFNLADDADWIQAQMTADPSGENYFRDLSYAWSMAESCNGLEIEHGNLAPMLAQEFRYGLATASLHSLLQNIPPAVLRAFADSNDWSHDQILAAALRHSDASNKCYALLAIADKLPASQCQMAIDNALVSAKSINDVYDRQKAVVDVIRHMPLGLRLKLLQREYRRARKELDPGIRADALAVLIPCLKDRQRRDATVHAQKALLEVHDAYALARATATLIPNLPRRRVHLPALQRALVIAGTIDKPHLQDKAMGAISLSLARMGYLHIAMHIVRAIPTGPGRAKALANMAIFLAKHGKIDSALPIAYSIKPTFAYERAEALTALAPQLPSKWKVDMLRKVLKWILALSFIPLPIKGSNLQKPRQEDLFNSTHRVVRQIGDASDRINTTTLG